MFAALNGLQTAKVNYQRHCMSAPFSLSTLCMFASICVILLTGVFTSVSLFVSILMLLLLVVVLVVLASLLLIGLTGLVRRESLVGLIKGSATRTAQGE